MQWLVLIGFICIAGVFAAGQVWLERKKVITPEKKLALWFLFGAFNLIVSFLVFTHAFGL